ncbi:hypothetical protein MHM84_08160 [Halomonas sp. McH1-25]|uniref:hypothetical protein n=1 Tax=unclassified Halomonas TaxID=2609666 RepID=UPI001EF5ED3D|nr:MULTISPECIES: hypothetical protein [unclassified Halomonas]MCG7599757.1 hypothetical protein [Halomonas sp. McH1-25]MCP1341653.1 hypothetical protein [Halomonas sp. FL8]MCP1359811.1 hypothetical protein [Halomonas sp. BBD45]MCP1365484.1 hypothetical protein [Halomonas sp. BBD48]
MMIVELIDGDDFRARLVALGIRIPEDACPDTCARMARRKYLESGVPGLEALVHDLMERSDIMLPSVRQAIERFLLPELR